MADGVWRRSLTWGCNARPPPGRMGCRFASRLSAAAHTGIGTPGSFDELLYAQRGSSRSAGATGGEKEDNSYGKLGASLLILHSAIDGSAIFAASQISVQTGLVLGLGVIAHDLFAQSKGLVSGGQRHANHSLV
jgi:zinc transporter ZupT